MFEDDSDISLTISVDLPFGEGCWLIFRFKVRAVVVLNRNGRRETWWEWWTSAGFPEGRNRACRSIASDPVHDRRYRDIEDSVDQLFLAFMNRSITAGDLPKTDYPVS